jgi:hypothetical protein
MPKTIRTSASASSGLSSKQPHHSKGAGKNKVQRVALKRTVPSTESTSALAMGILKAMGEPSPDARFPPNWQQIIQNIEKLLGRLFPDLLTLKSVNWHGVTQPAFAGTLAGIAMGDGSYVGGLPNGAMLINYTIYRYRTSPTDGILSAEITDGVIAPVVTKISLPAAIGPVTGVFNLNDWPTPFPVALYGHHELTLKLWTPSPDGQPLPARYQTSPPDARLFQNISTASCWMWIDPGCQKEGGLVSVVLEAFSVNPTTVPVQSNGIIPSGTFVKVTWAIDDKYPIAATAYGYPGSLSQVDLQLPNGEFIDLGSKQGTANINLGELAYTPGFELTLDDAPCSSGFFAVPIGAEKSGAPIKPGPADIVALTPDPPPNFIDPDKKFSITFPCINAGGTATGTFDAQFQWGDGTVINSAQVPSMDPGGSGSATLTFDDGLDEGLDYEVYCIFNPTEAVVESSYANNTSLLGFNVG